MKRLLASLLLAFSSFAFAPPAPDPARADLTRSAAASTQLDDHDRVCVRHHDGSLRLYVPESLRTDILRAAHDDPTSGHLSTSRTYGRLAERYFWPNMHADVRNWCASCNVCAQRTSPRSAPPGLLQPIAAKYPWEVVVIDYMGPLPVSATGNRYIIVLADHFSKWVEAAAVPTADATTTADFLIRHAICRFGTPAVLVSDRGSHFTAAVVSSLCRLLGVDRRTSTAYHPQTQGLVERFNATLADMMAKLTSTDQHDWDAHLPQLVWAYNTSIHASTGLTPFETLFGTAPVSVLDAALQPPRTPPTPLPDYVHQLQQRLVRVYDLVRDHAAVAADRHAAAYNRRHRDISYSVGDLVFLHTPRPQVGAARKLQSLWTGPWTVVERVGPLNYVVRLNDSERTQLVPITRLKPATSRAHHLADVAPTDVPPADAIPADVPPADALPDGFFRIDALIDRRPAGRGFKYRVRWSGYGADADTWEPRSRLPRALTDAYDIKVGHVTHL